MLTFNEPMRKGAGTVLLKQSSDQSTIESLDVSSPAVWVAGAVVTLDPAVTLGSSTGYYVEVPAGAFQDLAGNAFAGIAGTTTWNFTATDVIPPTVSTLSPADDATGVTGTTNLKITFTENIQKGTGSVVIRRLADDALVESISVNGVGVSIAGAAVTLDPSGTLASSTGYYVEVPAGALRDLAGNSFAGLAGQTSWNFTTSDFDAPTVSTLTPPDNATDAAVSSNLVITFNEPVQKGAGNVLLKRSSNQGVVESIAVSSAAVSVVGATVTIDPAVTLASVQGYYVEVPLGAFKDLAGETASRA